MVFSNAPDPLLPHYPISTTEADLPLNAGDLATSGALPARALRQNNARGEQTTRCKCGALCLTSQPSCPNCGEANWESCLDCGRSAGADSFFCEPCGDQRERAAEQYQRLLIDRLSEARKLRAAHRFDEAIAVLRALADTGLRKGDAEKVQCRIARIHEWRECQAEQMRAQVKQARRLIEQDCYELAATLLKQVVEPFRDAEVERLEQLARTRRHELARLYREIQQAVARKRPATALRAAERLLATAPNYKRAPAVRKLRRDCFLLQASSLIKKQRYEAALTLLEKIPIADRNHEVKSLTTTAKRQLPRRTHSRRAQGVSPRRSLQSENPTPHTTLRPHHQNHLHASPRRY